jgi:nucleolar pre-ribosomal-associated protein 2
MLQASRSRAAQEKLAELEKDSAPFDDQLVEAAKFIGFELEDIGRSIVPVSESGGKSKSVLYYGREEWLLRWLLKRLQAPKDDIPR